MAETVNGCGIAVMLLFAANVLLDKNMMVQGGNNETNGD
jgi:hypothetical protein